MIFIGLPGATWQSFPYRPPPKGSVRLSKQIIDHYERAMTLTLEAVQKQAAEDRSKGYSLVAYPPLREVQLSIRAFALQHYPDIHDVLKNSADAESRRAAAYALGYARPSPRQISDLINASHDPDDIVRNNAVRALAVIAGSDDARAAAIPAGPFMRMLKSSVWEDRNKALMLLGALSRRRPRELLRELKQKSLATLVEMARWRDTGHALDARLILGRIAAIEETQLQKLVVDDPEEIIRRVKSPHNY
jgi:HEAT repeat protein